jgi:thymidylate synthase
MMRNLLYNPQIQMLLVCGNDRSGSKQDLINFFELGLENVEGKIINYLEIEGVGQVSVCKISGTNRTLDNLVKPDDFQYPPKIILLGDPKQDDTLKQINNLFYSIQVSHIENVHRINIPLPEVEIRYFPSNPRSHQVLRENPLDAYIELLYTITRFGRRVTLKKGDRIELQNVKVVVEKPHFESENKLRALNFDPKKLIKYQQDILRSGRIENWRPYDSVNWEKYLGEGYLKGQKPLIPCTELRQDETYNYSHRLREHFNVDGIAECIARLKVDPEDRKAYFALWDSREDLNLEKKEGHPCLVSIFFRKFEEKLTLAANFRTHNAVDGWLLNFYGLMAIQKWVADIIEIQIGPITVISHSISINPKDLDRALQAIANRKWKLRLDPMGHFRVTIDGKEILVEHNFEGVTLKEYRSRSAKSLQNQIARDVALSDINHAMYLGRQLAKAEMALKEGREFVQD